MKLFKQILMIASLILTFILFDFFVFNVFTKRYFSKSELKAKQIEVDKYLPFAKETFAVSIKSDIGLEGKLPVLDGATALYPVFSGVAASLYSKDDVEFDGKDFSEKSLLQLNNTMGAYKRIVDEKSDIVFCAYPSEKQLQYAKDKGVELEFTVIGREAFVFFVNEKNPVDVLSQDEIRKIYSGEITNWKQVGGNRNSILPLRRIAGSGSQSAMDRFMGDKKIKVKIASPFAKAIAFSFRYYVSDITKYGGIKFISVDGIYPSVENIRNGSYPVTSYFYAVTRKDEDNPNVKKVVDWLLSEEGQTVIEANGYVGIK